MLPDLKFRQLAAGAFLLSSVGFVVGLLALLAAERPDAPDLRFYLSSPSGQADFELTVLTLTAAIILFLVGMMGLCGAATGSSRFSALLAVVFAGVAVPIFVGFLALEYALVSLAREGLSTSSEPYRVAMLQTHAAADWGGWTGVVVICCSLLAAGFAIVSLPGHRVLGYSAFATAGIGLLLIPLGYGFAFVAPLAVWQGAAAARMLSPGKVRAP